MLSPRPFSFALLATAVLLGAATPSLGSVTVNVRTSRALFVNDGDPGYYLKDGNASSRVLENEVFRMPVGSSGQPRWAPCDRAPCPRTPTPQAAPGSSGLRARRALSPSEVEFIEDEFDVVVAGSVDAPRGDGPAKQELPAALKPLRDAMKTTAANLKGASVADLAKAFQPLASALPAARRQDPSSPLVATAEKAVRLQRASESLYDVRTRTTAKVAGMEMVSCQVLKEGVSTFNRIAGEEAVTYYEQKAPLALIGLNSCLSQNGFERSMVEYIRATLSEAATATGSP
jgi:hypothetical protein